MTTRSRLLHLLRKHPGITVTELAGELGLTGMGVRRHLETLEVDGFVERESCARHGVGRPPNGWRLTAPGMELLPRRYDTFVLQLLEDVCEQMGEDGIDGVLRRRGDKMAAQYQEELAGTETLEERVTALARVRDQAGYMAECRCGGACDDAADRGAEGGDRKEEGEGGGDSEVLMLIEGNCAVHRVAERYPAVCAMELALFRKVLGPDAEVTRVSHTLAGDATCTYRIRPRPPKPSA